MSQSRSSSSNKSSAHSVSSTATSSSSGGTKAGTKRVRGVVVEKPIVFGNVAWWLGKKADATKTHRWIAYVRGPTNENISTFVKQVTFNLHPSFAKPKRGTFYAIAAP